MGADEAWDMRSNIKAKPGSQGTLFQPTTSVLNPQQRWPRGYTPERNREVGQMLDIYTQVHPTTMANPPRRATEVRARVQDAIARSTVPPMHLAGLREVHDQPAPGHEATYWPGRKTLAVNMFAKEENRPYGGFLGEMTPGSDEPDAGAKNLIHELGHHHDDRMRTTAALAHANKNILYAKNGRGMADAGEAVADNYYVEHYRGPGRKGVRAEQGRYEDTGLANRMPAYREVRPAPEHLGPQFEDVPLPGMESAGTRTRLDANRWAVGH